MVLGVEGVTKRMKNKHVVNFLIVEAFDDGVNTQLAIYGWTVMIDKTFLVEKRVGTLFGWEDSTTQEGSDG